MTATSSPSGSDLVADFVVEGIDSLQSLPAALEAYARDPQNMEPINAVFRGVHSIKGCAGFLNLAAIEEFAHSLENTLDEVRKQELPLTTELVRLLIQGFDLLTEQLQRAQDGSLGTQLLPNESLLLQSIAAATLKSDEVDQAVTLLSEIEQLSREIQRSTSPEALEWAGRIETLLDHYRHAQFDQEFEDATAEPAVQVRDFVGRPLIIEGKDATQLLAPLFDFFQQLEVQPYSEELGQHFLQSAQALANWAHAENLDRLEQVVIKARHDLQMILNSPLTFDAGLVSVIWDPLADYLCDFLPALQTKPISAASGTTANSGNAITGAATPADASKKSTKRMLRISEESVDHFFEHVSRLFISGELFKDLHLRMAASGGMSELVEELRQVNREFIAQSTALQQSVVMLRQVPVSALFSKFPRMARTLASQLGKQIQVEISGDEIEIDKSLIDDLDDVLTHMVRNTVDHGIELPDERSAVGKPECGTVHLRAEKTRSRLIVTIQDDGRGIDPHKLRTKAVEKGVLTAEQAATLSDQQSIELIYHAGFSTAEKVSEVSGRGVGMDVVVTNLREHNGEIFLSSTVGHGTAFRLEIPNREAVVVVNALMINQGGEQFAIPFSFVQEITELPASAIQPVLGYKQVATVRDRVFDAVCLGEILDLPRETFGPNELRPAVVVHSKYGSLCILADRIVHHRQIVVNSIRHVFPSLELVSGVAQLGGGRMALVLGIPEIVKAMTQHD